MTIQTVHTVDVPRPTLGFNVASRRARRHAVDTLRAFETLGEPCTYRFVMEDGSPVPPEQITEQESADVLIDLHHLNRKDPAALDALLELLYAASSHNDRSRVGPALDRLLEYVDHWCVLAPDRVAALFERLEPSRLVRAVGQTLLAATRLDGYQSPERQAFFSRFIDDLRIRGTPEATIVRLARGLEM